MNNLLALSGVNTRIGHYHILQGVDFVVPQGGLTMLLGRNGAGKTTCLRTIMGLWRASAGRIEFDGADIAGRSTPAVAQLGIGYVPESMGIFAGLTVRENLTLAARNGPIDETRLDWMFGLFPALKRDASKTILLVEHKMDVVRSLADRIIVLHNGRLMADGAPAEVIASDIVREAYLGAAA